jgi:ABC-type multidrug transport system ATPase subunit
VVKNAIEVQNISKSFGDVQALQDINLSIAKGELFGLIGPDGAGKSTLFKILTSLLIPDSGTAVVEGLDTVQEFKKLRKIIGYMPGRFSLYPDLSVEENLKFFATIFNTTIQDNYHLIEEIYVQLEPFKTRRADKLSGGMKQKLALCCALIHEPVVLFLDEPTTGVDAVSRDEFWVMLKRLKQRGITIVVSTPYMDEASKCERIALIQDSKILQIDTPAEVVAGYKQPLFAVKSSDPYKLLIDVRTLDFALRTEPFGEYLHVTTGPDIRADEIARILTFRGHKAVEVKSTQATVEDVFLNLIQ